MATAKRMTYFKTQVDNRPGGLLSLARDLKEQNIDLIGMKGVSHADQGDVLVIPKNPDGCDNDQHNHCRIHNILAGRFINQLEPGQQATPKILIATTE